MRFSALEIKGIRNLSPTKVEPCGGINILVGPNAGGKTSFLEAISLLSCSRSFRTRQLRQVIQDGESGFLVIAEIPSPYRIVIGVERKGASMRFHYDGDEIRTSSEQSRKVPTVLITPDNHQLISGSPKGRRRWMDHAVFHVKPSYLEEWKLYNKALRSRNSLLRKPGTTDLEFSVWEERMEKSASRITAWRKDFVGILTEKLYEVADCLSMDKGIEIVLMPGWNADRDLSDILQESRDRDGRLGYTTDGPHCADILFSIGRRPVCEFFSRGQQKKLFLAMAVALSLCLSEGGQGKPVIMVDDLSAELDKYNLAKFLTLLFNTGNQVFITCTDPNPILEVLPSMVEKAWFHVKHGEIYRLPDEEISEVMK